MGFMIIVIVGVSLDGIHDYCDSIYIHSYDLDVSNCEYTSLTITVMEGQCNPIFQP